MKKMYLTQSIRGIIHLMIILLLIIVAVTTPATAQKSVQVDRQSSLQKNTINPINRETGNTRSTMEILEPITTTYCPGNITVCADTIVNGVLGSYVTWNSAQFQLNIGDLPGSTSNFVMGFELPEVKWACWVFNDVQRLGQNSGTVNLWQSTGSGNPYMLSPSVYIEPSIDVSMDIINPDLRSFSWKLSLYNKATDSLIVIDTINISSALETVKITIPSSIPKDIYRLKFEFFGNGNNKVQVDNIYFDAILMDLGDCTQGIEFNVTGPTPGFFPVGDSVLTYTATYTPPSGSAVTATCSFTVLVEGVTANVVNVTNASCNNNNGSIAIAATSSSTTHNLEYKVGSGAWVPFGAGLLTATIPNLAPGTYSINVRELEHAGDCEILIPLSATVGVIPDTTKPIFTATPSNINLNGCNTSAITGLPYSESLAVITLAQFNSAGFTASDNCSVVYYAYKDTKSGTCPIVVLRTFTIKDQAGNTNTYTQTITITDNVAPVISNLAGSLNVTVECATAVPAVNPNIINATDNCGGAVTKAHVKDSLVPGTCINKKVIFRTYSAKDVCENTSYFVQVITVNDNIKPSLTCPPNQTVNTSSGLNTANVTVPTPAFSDNCVFVRITNSFNNTANASGIYPLGTTTVTWTATDTCGNAASCTHTITVVDNEKPTINCRADIVSCSPTVAIVAPIVSDNNGIDTLFGVRSDGLALTAAYPVGITTITWTVIDNSGNSATCVQKVTASNLSATAAITKVISCNGGSDGTLTVTATGGYGTLSYTLNGGTPEASNVFTGLTSGVNYTVVVRDASNCTATTNVITFTNPALLVATIESSTNINCYGNATGAINLTVTGGTGSHTYLWSNGATSEDLVGLVAGTYRVTVTDSKNCTATATATLTQPTAALAVSITGSYQVSCNNVEDGSVTVTALGGTAPYSYKLNGLGTAQSNPTFSNLSAGTYFVVVTDSKECSATTNSFTIINPPLLTVTAKHDGQVSCHDGNNGTITATALGGTPGYTYSIDGIHYQTSNVFSGLSAGTYVIVAKDSKGCTAATGNLIIENPSGLSASISVPYQVSCNNSTDGYVTVVPSGGTPPYQFSLKGGSFTTPTTGSYTFQNLAAGSYWVIVKDSEGCTYTTETKTIVNPPLLTLTAKFSAQVTCNNAEDGWISVTPSGGTPGFTFSINGGAFQTSPDFINLDDGTYTIVVKDSKGCTATVTGITISNPSKLTATATGPEQVSCNGAQDGWIKVSASGGTGSYTYILNGEISQTGNVFTGLAAGSYFVVVKDSMGCVVTTNTVIIANPLLLTATTTSSPQVSCYGSQDGWITVEAKGGTPPYLYSLNSTPFTSNFHYTGLASGAYTIVVKDSKDCITNTLLVNIALPAPLTIRIEHSAQVSCNGDDDGYIAVFVTGGTGDIHYILNNGEPQESNIFTNLSAGEYQITAVDDMGCRIASEKIIVVDPPMLEAWAKFSTQVTCHDNNDGFINITAEGGTQPYLYSINGIDFVPYSEFNGLSAGEYTLVVKDIKGCIFEIGKVKISNPEPIAAKINASSQVSCSNASDGTIEVFAQGGTGTLTYSIDGVVFQEANTFNGLPAGTYVVTIKDKNDCILNIEGIIINNPETINLVVSNVVNPSCYGSHDGSVTLTASGGTGDYEYSIDGINFQESNVFTGLEADDYTVVVKDEKGCMASVEVNIIDPAILTVTAEITQTISCNGASDATITATAEGGTGTYTYVLQGEIDFTQSSNVFTNVAPGTYHVIVVDEHGCSSSSAEIIIGNPPILFATAIITHEVTCSNGNDGEITVNARGGTAPYRYSIDGRTWQDRNVFTNLPGGDYKLWVRDSKLCEATDDVYLANPSPVTVHLTASLHSGCNSDNEGFITIDATGGSGEYKYSLDGITFGTTSTFTGLSNGNYTVYVTDISGCVGMASISIDYHFAIDPEVSSTNNNCLSGEGGKISINIKGGSEPFNYQWSNGSTEANPENLRKGTYTVTITDAGGCSTTHTVTIYNIDNNLDVKNVFTPNNDGINDKFVVKFIELHPENTVTIFNRWGNEVYSEKSYKNTWDGSQLNEGTYFYVITITLCDEEKEYAGSVLIKR